MSGRKRFTFSDDIALVKKVLYVNPFLDPARWLKITDRLSEVLGSDKNCDYWLRNSSGTEEKQSELEDLLQQAADIARECGYTPPPSTARQLTERDDIEKRATRNSVVRPPAKRRVDNKEEDALAAYAELTAGDGVEPELEDNRTASCPAPDRITTAAPSRAQTPASSPSDFAVAGSQRYAEATYALIEARCDRDTAIENHRLQLEDDRLRFELKRHEEKIKLKEMDLQQRQAEQEAKIKLKELELEALAEERRHNKSYQEAQLEIIKSFINK
ncbi:hypothetical protein HPB51_005952 [Rhipicephalus microplus]|uniref:Uncharacterized protein n=1 Tax=Rhipicephalus microplus TaxID=6941 RepID=A0A9J6EFA0_RHIMP|nr:hypothetical protein HPB51_005952 [Rhipicephalus microplus]